MKTYIVKEQAFAGSVTVGVQVYGVAAESFKDAAGILRAIVESKGGEVDAMTEKEIRYSFPSVSGSMEDEALQILSMPAQQPATTPSHAD